MGFKRAFLLYLLTVPVFFLIDMVWLGFVAKGFYRRHLGDFLAPKFNWTAAIVFYLLFIVGILVFAVLPGMERGSFAHCLLMGVLFGFFTYATYDLTNLATLKGWPMPIVIVDIIWGMVLSGSVAAISFLIGRKML
jgi:uncharacterized membrane protein